MTKSEIIAELKKEFPIIKIGSDEVGYIELDALDYEALINEWADNKLMELDKVAKLKIKADAKEAAQAKLAALGLTSDDLAALGL
jgi:hypothetical protein